MTDWLVDHIGWVLAASVVAFMVLIGLGVSALGRERAEFMAACTEDLKPYECEAMWRAGNRSPVFVPVYT